MRADVREVLRVLLFILGILVVCGIMAVIAHKAMGAEEADASLETWDQWGAGDLWLPGEPWKDGCTDDWCPSLKEGAERGLTWCFNKPGCPKYHRRESYRIYKQFQPWIEMFSGGQPAVWMAQRARTESEGVTDSQPKKSGTGECGVVSIDRKHAKKHNVDACDPKGNFWASGYAANNRLLTLRQKKPAIQLAPLEEQWLIAGAAGGMGSGKLIKIMKLSGALSTKKIEVDGEKQTALRYKSPIRRACQWCKSLHNKWAKAVKIQHVIDTLGLDKGLGKAGVTHEAWKGLEQFAEVYDPHGEWSGLWTAEGGGKRPGRT